MLVIHELGGLFVYFEPAGVGVLKHITQISDLVGRQRIEIGLLQRLKCLVDDLELDLTQLVFFHGNTPDAHATDMRRI